MRVLLDTNIIIHRESNKTINEEIGTLFNWLDRLSYTKCIHPLSMIELNKNINPETVKTIQIRLKSYNTLMTEATESIEISNIRKKYDNNENDNIDTSLLKELFCKKVNFLISEDRKIHTKARDLGIAELVFTIDDFLEKVTSENPKLKDYKVLAV